MPPVGFDDIVQIRVELSRIGEASQRRRSTGERIRDDVDQDSFEHDSGSRMRAEDAADWINFDIAFRAHALSIADVVRLREVLRDARDRARRGGGRDSGLHAIPDRFETDETREDEVNHASTLFATTETCSTTFGSIARTRRAT